LEEKRRKIEEAERQRREDEDKQREEEERRLAEAKRREEAAVLTGAIRLQALYRGRLARTAFRSKRALFFPFFPLHYFPVGQLVLCSLFFICC
jgi:colicin import membrane protein